MNMPGFTATISIKELRGFRATKLESGVARASTLIEPQQIPGIFRPLSWLELRCPQATDHRATNAPCLPSFVNACQVWQCHQNPSLFGGSSCQLLGNVNYPGCMYQCYYVH